MLRGRNYLDIASKNRRNQNIHVSNLITNIMNKDDFERNFTCPICDEFADNPYEGECCGVIICEACLNRWKAVKTNCPKCYQAEYKTHPSVRIRMIISNSVVDCAHQCGLRVKIGNKKAHEKLCLVIREFFKNQEKLSQLINDLSQLWDALFTQSVVCQSHLIKPLKQCQKICQQSLLTILKCFKNAQKQPQNISKYSDRDDQYWHLLLLNSFTRSNLLKNLCYMFSTTKNYLEAVRHSLVLLHLQFQSSHAFFALQVLGNGVRGIIKEKKGLEQCYELVLQFFGYLRKEDQSHFCAYLVCLKSLVELAYALGKFDQEEEFTIMLSRAEENSHKACHSILQKVCWYAHVLSRIQPQPQQKPLPQPLKQPPPLIKQQKNPQKPQKTQKKSLTKVLHHNLLHLLTILHLTNKPILPSILSLLSSIPSIISSQIYHTQSPAIHNNSMSVKSEEVIILNTVIDSCMEKEGAGEGEGEERLGGVYWMERLMMEPVKLGALFWAVCYLGLDRKFKGFNQDRQIVSDKFRNILQQLVFCQLYKQQYGIRNIIHKHYTSLSQFLQLPVIKTLPQPEKTRLHSIAPRLLQTLCRNLCQIVRILGEGNINARNEMFIRYQISKFYTDMSRKSNSEVAIQCVQGVFYGVVSEEGTGMDCQVVKDGLAVIGKVGISQGYVEMAKKNIRDAHRVFNVQDNLRNPKNTTRDEIFSKQNVDSIVNSFAAMCLKPPVINPQRTIAKIAPFQQKSGPKSIAKKESKKESKKEPKKESKMVPKNESKDKKKQ